MAEDPVRNLKAKGYSQFPRRLSIYKLFHPHVLADPTTPAVEFNFDRASTLLTILLSRGFARHFAHTNTIAYLFLLFQVPVSELNKARIRK